MRPDWAMVWVVGVLAAFAGAAVMREVRSVGRYQIAAGGDGGPFRLDTTTGEVVGCRTSREVWPRFDCATPLASR